MVEESLTNGAFPDSNACCHLDAQRHHKSPWTNPLKSNSGLGVDKSFPTDFENSKNLDQITCFSNEANKWRNSKISLREKNILEIDIVEKFVGERGRINCSLNDNGKWRWFGVQFPIIEN